MAHGFEVLVTPHLRLFYFAIRTILSAALKMIRNGWRKRPEPECGCWLTIPYVLSYAALKKIRGEEWERAGREYCIWSISSSDMCFYPLLLWSRYAWRKENYPDAVAWLFVSFCCKLHLGSDALENYISYISRRFPRSSLRPIYIDEFVLFIMRHSSAARLMVMKAPDSNTQQCSAGVVHRQIFQGDKPHTCSLSTLSACSLVPGTALST